MEAVGEDEKGRKIVNEQGERNGGCQENEDNFRIINGEKTYEKR